MKKVYSGPQGGLYTLTKSGKKSYVSNADRGLPKKTARHWQLHLKKNTVYCGPAGGAAPYSFPVNTEKRCRAALSYSRFAPSPCGVAQCALKQARKHGWKCGTSSKRAQSCARR